MSFFFPSFSFRRFLQYCVFFPVVSIFFLSFYYFFTALLPLVFLVLFPRNFALLPQTSCTPVSARRFCVCVSALSSFPDLSFLHVVLLATLLVHCSLPVFIITKIPVPNSTRSTFSVSSLLFLFFSSNASFITPPNHPRYSVSSSLLSHLYNFLSPIFV